MPKPTKKKPTPTDSTSIDVEQIKATDGFTIPIVTPYRDPRSAFRDPLGDMREKVERSQRSHENKRKLLGLPERKTQEQIISELRSVLSDLANANPLRPSDQLAIAKQLVAQLEAETKHHTGPALAAPTSAPERWEERDKSTGETAVEFACRVYEPWISAGVMPRKLWLKLDEPLYKAYGVRVARHPDEAIPGLETQTDWVDTTVADLADKYTPEDLRKLGLALEYRRKRANQGDA